MALVHGRRSAVVATGTRSGVDRLLADILSARAGHRRLVEYVARQVALGRHLGAVLEDPYVVSRTRHLDRRYLLEDPALVHAWHLSLERALARGPGPARLTRATRRGPLGDGLRDL